VLLQPAALQSCWVLMVAVPMLARLGGKRVQGDLRPALVLACVRAECRQRGIDLRFPARTGAANCRGTFSQGLQSCNSTGSLLVAHMLGIVVHWYLLVEVNLGC
jgi:hypothetical protein